MTAATWTQPEYEAVASLVAARTGLAFAPTRCRDAELGIRRAMTHMGVSNFDEYRESIESDADALDDLIVQLTVGETYFFREPAQFEFIRREVLPDICRRSGDQHVIRAWSAGCASGEEPYSLAILLDEAGFSKRSHILATDISRAALAKARKAEYSAWSLRGDGAAAAKPYLIQRGARYVLDEQIRRRVAFEHLNLALDVYPSFATGTCAMDLILCRNVLIYFDRQTIRIVAQRLFDSLAPGAWLITGSSDPSLSEDAPYQTVVTDAGVFYRRGHLTAVKDTDSATQAADERKTPIHWDAGRSTGAATQRCRDGVMPGRTAALHKRQEPHGQIAASLPPDDAAAYSRSSLPSSVPVSALLYPLGEAQDSLHRGDYGRAVELTRGLQGHSAACAIHVKALANIDVAQAERECAEATQRHPLSTELHYLHAVLLIELERDAEAIQAARRVLYLDRSLALAHFTLGSVLRSRGDFAGARRAYENARNLCAARPSDETVPLSDGERAGSLAEAATAQLTMLVFSVTDN